MNRLVHNARRVAQTLTRFEGGQTLLRHILQPDRFEELRFSTRSGPVIACPNVPGARVPVYEVFADDSYRLDSLLAGLPDATSVLDIGGHIGCFSVAIGSRDPQARIHSYEASPGTAQWLQRNVSLNGLEDRITVHAEAVSDRNGTLEFEDNDGGSSLNRVTETQSATSVTVTCVSLEDAFARCETSPDLVKIDTEGAEYQMVLGTDPGIWSSVQRLVLEYHDVPGHDWSELESHLGKGGLKAVRRDIENPRQGVAWFERVA
ncbi:MAG: FkbM family methyltransferase [Marmoricola sp.]